MAQSFDDFLKTQKGQQFKTLASTALPSYTSLRDDLDSLIAEMNIGAVATMLPTYEPVLLTLLSVAAKGADAMRRHGVATRDVQTTFARSKQHSFCRGMMADVFNALAQERKYHDMMFDAARETVQNKSPSDAAFTVLGLLQAAKTSASTVYADAEGDQQRNFALKFLKDATATALRAIQEAEEPGSIAKQALQHYQSKHGPGTP